MGGRPASLHTAWASLSGPHTEPAAVHHDGGRGGSVRDPEGNHWSFGSYQPGAEAGA